ncbi:MAG: 50S ribosomal protein L3 [Puniceicoccales bacterium]|jgi:large subunit ribosomal protein L3|nr:50S ribosomal protein L3 [Puniceicoccales bacterium]
MEEKKRAILLFGRKLGMTRVNDVLGNAVVTTAIHVNPCTVVQLRTLERNGYSAVSIGAEPTRSFRLSRAENGHFAKNGCKPHKILREIRVSDSEKYKPGEILDLSLLQEGQLIDVVGVTKGRGFQGVMKRHGFSGGPASHGSMFHRRGGSYGQREEPGRIYPGRKMPGRMGGERRTTQNLKIARIYADRGLFFVRGSVAGANGGLLMIRTAKKG